MPVKHTKQVNVPDVPADPRVQGSDWNAPHTLEGNLAALDGLNGSGQVVRDADGSFRLEPALGDLSLLFAGRAVTEEALADLDFRVEQIESGVSIAPVFATPSSTQAILTTLDQTVVLPTAQGPDITYQLSMGSTPVSGTIKVNGVATTLPRAVVPFLDVVSVDFPDNPQAAVTETQQLVLTASNAFGTATHTVDLAVDIRIPVFTGVSDYTLTSGVFMPLQLALQHADNVRFLTIPADLTVYESNGGPTIAQGTVLDAGILATAGFSSTVNGSYDLVLEATNDNATVTFTVTALLGGIVAPFDFLLDTETTKPLGISAPNLVGNATVVETVATGKVEKLVPGTSEPGKLETFDQAAGYIMANDPDPKWEGNTVWQASGTGNLSYNGDGVLDAQQLVYDCGDPFDHGVEVQMLVAPTDVTNMRTAVVSFVDDDNMYYLRPAASNTAFEFRREQAGTITTLATWSTPGGVAITYPHRLKLTVEDSAIANQRIFRGYYNGTEIGDLGTTNVTVLGQRAGITSSTNHPAQANLVGEMILFGPGLTHGTPDSWVQVNATDVLTKTELEGLRVSAVGVADGVAMGEFEWTGSDGSNTIGEVYSIATEELPASGSGPDPLRAAIYITPLDGPNAGIEARVPSEQAVLLDNTTAVRGGVQYRWALPPVNLGAHANHPTQTDVLQLYLTYIQGGTYDGRYEVIARMPFKTIGEGSNNHVGRAYKWRMNWDGVPLTLYPLDDSVPDRTNPSVGDGVVVNLNSSGAKEYRGHSRSTEWRWQSQVIAPDWTKLPALIDSWSILPHNDTAGYSGSVDPVTKLLSGTTYYPAGGVGRALTASVQHTAQGDGQNVRYGIQPVADEFGQYFSYRSRVANILRAQGTAGDRAEIGWDHEYFARAVLLHRKGLAVERDKAWARYVAQCNHYGQLPLACLWNFTEHRPLMPSDSGNRSTQYHTHENPVAIGSNPFGIVMPVDVFSDTGSQIFGYGRARLNMSHDTNLVFSAYLLTEDPYYLELAQMKGMFAAIHAPGNYKQALRDHVTGDEERGWAWAVRSISRAWKVTPSSGAPATRFLTKAQLQAFCDGTAAFITDIFNHQDTSGSGLPSAILNDVAGTPARALGVMRRANYIAGLGTGSPEYQAGVKTSVTCRGTSIFMFDYWGASVAMAVLQGLTSFKPVAERLASGFYKLRYDTGGGYLLPYAVGIPDPGYDGPSSQSNQRDGTLLYAVERAESDSETPPYRASSAQLVPAAWKDMFADQDNYTPHDSFIFATGDNGFIDITRVWNGHLAYRLLEKAQDAALISVSYDLTLARQAYKDAVRLSTSNQVALPGDFDPRIKFQID